MAFLLLLLLQISGHAEEPLRIGWGECVKMVDSGNAELAAARSTYEASRAQERVPRNGFLPQISGAINYVKASPPAAERDGQYTGSITATQNLFNGFSDLGKLRQARANSRAASAALQIAKAKVSNDLKVAFEALSYARQYTRLTAEIIQRRQENLRLVQMRFQGGRENQGSVLLSKAYFAQAKVDDLQARNAERTAQAQLAAAVGLDHFASIVIQDEIPIREPESSPDFARLALETPDYSQAQAQQEAADQGVAVSRAPFFPVLDLKGSANQVGSSFFPHDQERWRIEANLTIPLFNGGRDYFNSRAAVATSVAAEATRVHVSRQLLTKLERVYATYTEAVAGLSAAESFREAAQLRAEIARKKYNNGLLSFEDWDLIENDLISRQKSVLQIKRDRVLAEAAWDQALGRGVIP